MVSAAFERSRRHALRAVIDGGDDDDDEADFVVSINCKYKHNKEMKFYIYEWMGINANSVMR